MSCLFCQNTNDLKNIEHIIPESLGNKSYVLDSIKICNICNNKFSDFENKALSKTILGFERARLRITTKKSIPAKGTINGMEWTSNLSGNKNDIIIKGFDPETLKEIGPNTYEVRIPICDNKTQVALSKLLLKIGIESIVNSLPDIANKYNISEAKEFVKGEKTMILPYAIPRSYMSSKFIDYLNNKITSHLNSFECRASYRELNGYLLFRFKYGGFTGLICLNSNTKKWINDLEYEKKSKFTICPNK